MAKMNWTRVRWEQRTRTHGSESVAEDPTLPPGVFDPYPRLGAAPVAFVKPPAKKPEKKLSKEVNPPAQRLQRPIQNPRLPAPGNPVLLVRELDSWLIRDPFMQACDNGDLTEILRTLNVLKSRVDSELRQRLKRRGGNNRNNLSGH